MSFENMKETLSATPDDKIGGLLMFAVESSSADEIGENIRNLFESFDNEDQLEVFQSVIRAITGQTLDELIEEDRSI